LPRFASRAWCRRTTSSVLCRRCTVRSNWSSRRDRAKRCPHGWRNRAERGGARVASGADGASAAKRKQRSGSNAMVKVGVVGATGLVGTEMLRQLEERSFPVSELRVYASPRSEGRRLAFAGGDVVCEVLRDGCFDGLDLVVIDVDDPLSLEWAPR